MYHFKYHLDNIQNYILLSGADDLKEPLGVVGGGGEIPLGFPSNYPPALRLPTSYPATAESFAYAQYTHDSYLMAAKARQTPYSRNIDYGAAYRHTSHLKPPYQQGSAIAQW